MKQINPALEPDLSPKPPAAISGVHTARDIVEEFSFLRLKPKSDAEVEAYMKQQEEERRQRRVAWLQEKCNAPPLHWNRRDLDRSGEWGKVEKSLLKRLGKGGLLIALVGLRGNGKTQLAVEAARYTTDVLVLPARFVTMTEFFMELRATYGPNATETELDVMNRYRRPQLVVFDEFARRSENDWENRVSFEVVNKRYGDMKDTIFIANQERLAFLESVGPSIASRITELGAVIDCTWPTFRKPAGQKG